MSANPRQRWRTALLGAAALVISGLVAIGPASPAHADPGCVSVLVMYARGSGAPFNSNEANAFKTVRENIALMGVSTGWVELGNEDGDNSSGLGWAGVGPNEYPAVGVTQWGPNMTGYGASVQTGTDELVAYLNHRYAPTPSGMSCDHEAVVFGGHSQGADVIGAALQRTGSNGLSATARTHIAYVALYGDPKFDAGDFSSRAAGARPWWVQGDDVGYGYRYDPGLVQVFPGGIYGYSRSGVLGARSPYIPSDFQPSDSQPERFGSWCDKGDPICTTGFGQVVTSPFLGTHLTAYAGGSGWIAASTGWIRHAAVRKVMDLDSSQSTVLGAYTGSPPAPPQTLTITQGLSVWPGANAAMYQPLKWSYTIQNTSGSAASIARLEVAVRAPDGSAQDVPCFGGYGVTLQPNDIWTCDARLPQGYGSQGTYTYWADWMGYDGAWHHGQLGSDRTFTLSTPYTLSVSQPVSVGPSASVSMYTQLNWSYQVKNTSGSAASIQRFIVAVRAPDGSNQDVPCANGTGVTLQPGDTWTCAALLPQGYGSQGTFAFWADWQGYDNQWHVNQLGWSSPLVLGPAPTLTTTGALSVGPSSSLAMYQPVYWSYRVKNTSGFATSIKRLEVAVRTPGGGAMDVPCQNGDGVTLAPGEEWTCAAYNDSGYGSTGSFPFWADWQGYDNAWHPGALSGTLTMNVGPPNILSQWPSLSISPGTSVAANTGVTFTYTAKNTTGGGASIQRFIVAVRGPNNEVLDVPCQNGNGVSVAAGATFACTASVPAGYATTGGYTVWADWQDYNGNWHDGQLSRHMSLYVD